MSAHETNDPDIPAEHLQSLLSASIAPSLVLRSLNRELTIVGGNDLWGDLCGASLRDLVRRTPAVCMSAELVDAIQRVAEDNHSSAPVSIPTGPAHTVATTQVQVTVIPTSPHGGQQFLLLYAQPTLDGSEPVAESILATMAGAVLVLDSEFAITYANAAVEQLLGWRVTDLFGTDVRALVHAESVEDLVAYLHGGSSQSASSQSPSLRLQMTSRSGQCRTVEASARPMPDPSHTVLGLHDLTAQQLHEEALADQSVTDLLTGLANRQTFSTHIDRIAGSGKACEVTVAFLDLDNFKTINDAFGHDQGDVVLQTIAKRLGNAVGSFGLLSRFGGDEFVVATEAEPGTGHAELLYLLGLAFADPVELDGRELTITVSVGIATATDPDAINANGLLKAADTAMYEAKRQGKNCMVVFDESLQHAASARIEIESDLRLAIEREEFVLHYQPIVDVITGRAVRCEALVRWVHPERGLIPPNDFIPIAEETGLIVPLGAWVLDKAIEQTAAWNRKRMTRRALGISVNLSALQLGDADLERGIHAALSRHGFDPGRLTLEVTESTLMVDGVETMAILERLGDLGIRIAIDDFGTGYSSLAYLKKLPADALKIDKAFVDGLGTLAEDTALVTGIVGLASALNLEIVAEGVESETQLRELRRLGCEYSQGYLHSRPLPAEDFEAWITEHDPDATRRGLESTLEPVNSMAAVGIDPLLFDQDSL